MFIKTLTIVYSSIIMFSVTSCISVSNKNIKQNKSKTDLILKKYLNRNVDFVYKDLGEPMENKILVNDKNKIVNAKIIYKYIYNFKQKKYDCHIGFFIDVNSKKIVSFEKSSDKCDYIFND